jgi:hypothetical protein
MDSKVNWRRWLAFAGLIACVTPDVYAALTISGGSASSSVRPVSLVVSDSGGDYTTIEAAIAALPVGGATIMVKRGSYTPVGMLTIPSNVTLQGEGPQYTIIHSALGVTSAITLGGSDAVIRNLQVDGATNTSGGVGIAIASGAHRCRISEVYLHDTVGGHGISNDVGGDDLTIENCRITNTAVAASNILSSPALTNSGNAIFWVGPGMASKFSTGAIKVGSQSATISAIKALKTYVSVGTSTTVFDVLDPTGFANGDVIRVGPVVATISTISSNHFTLSGALSTVPTPGQIVAIDRITLSSTLSTTTAGQIVAPAGGVAKGIYAAGVKRTTVRGCYVKGWSQGIGFWYGAVEGTIDGCTVVDNYGYEEAAHTTNRSAIELYPTVNIGHNRVINTVIDGSTHNCIEVAQGETGSVIQNVVLSNWATESGLAGGSGSAIEFAGASGQTNLDCAISGSTIVSNGAFASAGVLLTSYAYNTKVSGNTFTGFSSGTTAYPIYVGGGIASRISGNTFEYNTRDVIVNSADPAGVIEGCVSTLPATLGGAMDGKCEPRTARSMDRVVGDVRYFGSCPARGLPCLNQEFRNST